MVGAVWATRLRVSAWARRHWRRALVTAVLAGGIAGLVMGVVAGTRRTGSAPDRYTRQAGGDPDLMITQFAGPPITDDVGRLPGVVSVRSQTFVPAFLVSPSDGSALLEPNPFVGDDAMLGSRIVEGRFTDPDAPDEFTVNRAYADALASRFGTEVGDRFAVASFSQAQVDANFDAIDQPEVPPVWATLVGVTEAPSGFDDLTAQIVFSRSFLRANPDVGVVQTAIDARLAPGIDPRAVMDEVHRLPNGADAFVEERRVVSDSARRAVRFQVTALWGVCALAVVGGSTVIAQLAVRTLRVDGAERRSLGAIGWRRRDLAGERAVEAVLTAVLAAPVATVVAALVASAFPLGGLRLFEPDPGVRLDGLVTAAGLVALALVVVGVGVGVAWRAPGPAVASRPAGRAGGGLSARAPGMPLAIGARFAAVGTDGRRSWGSLVVGGLGVAALAGSCVVGLSLTRIADRPARWGVNYDHLVGNPYTDAGDIVGPIAALADVVAVTGANLGSLTINGSDVKTVAFHSAKGALGPTVLEGRLPGDGGEIGLGAEVAHRLDVGVGDSVSVAGSFGDARQLAVVGIVVTPAAAGNGAAVTFDAYRAMNPAATENIALVNFRDGTPQAVIDAVVEANYTPPDSVIKPTSVRALERVAAVPFLLGALLTVLLFVSSAYLLATSVRGRRHDLGVLRALGADERPLRSVVHWQATLVAVAITVTGIPLGIVGGRWVVSLLTDALGIVPGVEVPVAGVAGGLVASLVVANVLALGPARRAARVPRFHVLDR
jgi:hypothetical protein